MIAIHRRTLAPAALGLLLAGLCPALGAGEPRPPGVDIEWATRLPDGKTEDGAKERLLKALGDAARPYHQPLRDEVCGCALRPDGRVSDPVACAPVFKTGDEAAGDVVPVAIVEPSSWGQAFACYRHGSDACVDRRHGNVAYIGETCCRAIDPLFTRIAGDVNLSILMPRPVAASIAGYAFAGADTQGFRRVDAACSVVVDDAKRRWGFVPAWRGYLARAEIYAARHYGAHLTRPAAYLDESSRALPPSEGEFSRARAAGSVQGGRVQDVTLERGGR